MKLFRMLVVLTLVVLFTLFAIDKASADIGEPYCQSVTVVAEGAWVSAYEDAVNGQNEIIALADDRLETIIEQDQEIVDLTLAVSSKDLRIDRLKAKIQKLRQR